eukprot:gene1534-919_t
MEHAPDGSPPREKSAFLFDALVASAQTRDKALRCILHFGTSQHARIQHRDDTKYIDKLDFFFLLYPLLFFVIWEGGCRRVAESFRLIFIYLFFRPEYLSSFLTLVVLEASPLSVVVPSGPSDKEAVQQRVESIFTFAFKNREAERINQKAYVAVVLLRLHIFLFLFLFSVLEREHTNESKNSKKKVVELFLLDCFLLDCLSFDSAWSFLSLTSTNCGLAAHVPRRRKQQPRAKKGGEEGYIYISQKKKSVVVVYSPSRPKQTKNKRHPLCVAPLI